MVDERAPQDQNQPVSPQQGPALGPPVAEPATESGPGATGLPPGTHPLDPSVPLGTDPRTLDRGGIAIDQPGDRFDRGGKPWSTKNQNAFPVYQRAAEDWDGGVVVANSAFNGGTSIVVGRQKGRLAVKLWVPAKLADGTIPNPVVFGPNESELQSAISAGGVVNNAPVLNVGDAITIETEGSIYIGVVGANLTGTVQYLVLTNPLGGPAGGD